MSIKTLVIGGTGAIGAKVVAALQAEKDTTVLIGGRSDKCDVQIDINDPTSVAKALAPFKEGTADDKNKLHHIFICCGDGLFKHLTQSTRADYTAAFNSKVLGQIDVALQAKDCLVSGGSITLTSGCLDKVYIPAGVAASALNASVNAFARSAANEMPRGTRINAVSPGLLTESAATYGPFFRGFKTVDGSDVALAYIRSAFGGITGKVLEVTPGNQFMEA